MVDQIVVNYCDELTKLGVENTITEHPASVISSFSRESVIDVAITQIVYCIEYMPDIDQGPRTNLVS